ncbi:C40 family peptidase [Gordoniibacillus kamchatkensis]|uniref:C40 family peptidase n=1 Tax=Gordoniibacillus kamchatkensis TaxID=1590651 RepID=UPI00069778D1|nr:C40 family peptidase [Paenibacillus sp. VKM B-2647]
MNRRIEWRRLLLLLPLVCLMAACSAGKPAALGAGSVIQGGDGASAGKPEGGRAATPGIGPGRPDTHNEFEHAGGSTAAASGSTIAEPLCRPESGKDAEASPSVRYVNVNVATLWASPQAPRALDEPSLRFPADVPAWLGPMTVRDKLGLVGKTETEALYGERVVLLEERGDWVRVAVPEQRTPKLAQGYPGWLPKRQLAERSEAAAYAGCPVAVIGKRTATLYADAELRKPALQLSFGTRLPVVAAAAGLTLTVVTPDDGRRYLAASDAIVRKPDAAIAPPSGTELVELGRGFLGLPYLWAGASGFGFDCSGFTYALYRYYGILLPRDAKDQAKAGRAVDRADLQPGDLLFFAYDKGKGAVHHVAMYAGDGLMLHSPKTERSVELIPFDTPEYAAEFAGARRFLP